MGPQGADDPPSLRATGARGAAAHELMRRYFERNRHAYTEAVTANMTRAQQGRYDPDDVRLVSARNHFANEVPNGGARTLGYLGFGIAMAWDHLNTSQHLEAMDVLSRFLVGVEQAAIESINMARRLDGQSPLKKLATEF